MLDGGEVGIVIRHAVNVICRGVNCGEVRIEGSSVRRGDGDKDTVGNEEVECDC